MDMHIYFFLSHRLNEESSTSNKKLKAVDKNTLPPKKKRKVDVKKYFVDETFSDFEEACSSENSEMEEDNETHKDSEILEGVENNENKKLDEQLINDKHGTDSNCDDSAAENKRDIISSSDSSSKETLVLFKHNKSDSHDNKAIPNNNCDSSSKEETTLSAKQNKAEYPSNKNIVDAEHIPAVFVPLNRKPEIQVKKKFSPLIL